MRCVGDELALRPGRRLETTQELVQCAHQFRELVIGALERKPVMKVGREMSRAARVMVCERRSTRPAIGQPNPIDARAMIPGAPA
jgi:hypothetical protein